MGPIFAGQTTSSGSLTRVAKAVSKAVSSGVLGLHGPYHFCFQNNAENSLNVFLNACFLNQNVQQVQN